MADITKCNDGVSCEKHEICYRFLAKDDYLQSYSDFANYCNRSDYEMFIPLEEER